MARKILLADDSVTAQNMGRKILADAGYEVVTVNNGSAALKRVREMKPDIVVLDIYMPGYSGLEVCQMLKSAADTAHIPVLLSVGKLEPFKLDEARRVRADAHIVKPFEASELLKALGQLADRILPASEVTAPPSPAKEKRVKTETASKEAAAGNEAAASAEGTSGANHLRLSVQKTKEREKTESSSGTDGAFHDFRGVPVTPNQPASPNQSEAASAERAGTRLTAARQTGAGESPDIPNDITADELDALSVLVARLEAPPTSEKLSTPGFEKPAAATTSESPAPEGIVDPVNVTQFSQEPASIDQQDEPIFAVTEYAGSHFQPKATEAVAASAELSADGAKADERKMLESAGEPARFETFKTQSRMESSDNQATEFEVPKANVQEAAPGAESGVPVESELQTKHATAQANKAEQVTPGEIKSRDVEPDDEKSSEEELAEALRALTQAGSRAASPLYPMEMPAVFSTSRNNNNEALATSPRWRAEPVPVDAEEAASLLEAEMFAGIANKAAQEALSGSGSGIEGPVVGGATPADISTDIGHEPQKAMAAVATTDGAPSSLADAGTVANIVDRVLADLRPRIVEEITRKLSGK